MTEHWFLDLDGVRSGPYQTPEILSLIAEGEVMPHHRISTGLKNQQWMSIIDWRFEQAKKPERNEKEVKEVQSYIPASSRPPAAPKEPKIELATDDDRPEPEPIVEPLPEVSEASTLAQEFTVSEPGLSEPKKPAIEEQKPAPHTAPPTLKLEPVEHTPPRATTPPDILHSPAYMPPPIEEEEIPTQSFDAPVSKRDPMAEMFDVLQTSKQKREAKSQQVAQQQNYVSSEPVASSSSNNGLAKTLGIGVLITVIGFALGQIFQQSAPPPEPKAATTPAQPATKTEVIDRSTDKITIRGKVEVPVQKPSASAQRPALGAKSGAGAPAATPHTEKDLQELKDLKKELQELKALKDEMRNNPNVANPGDEAPENIDEFDNGNIGNSEVDQGYNYYPTAPTTNGGAAAYPNGFQNPSYPRNGQQPSPNQNVHY